MGLREIKKNRLREAVEREALRLFEEQGYESTTVEQIAAAAEISTTTFYRYFSSKEDVVLSGAHGDDQGLQFFEPPPPGRPLADGFRIVIDRLRRSPRDGTDSTNMLARFRLIGSIPELRALQQQRVQESIQSLSRLLAEPTGADPDSLQVRVIAAMVGGAVAETLHYWVDRNGEPNLTELLARALEMIVPAIDH